MSGGGGMSFRSVDEALGRAHEIIQTTDAAEVKLYSFERDVLVLAGSFDHSYYHQFELRFSGVIYVALPTWPLSAPRFSRVVDPARAPRPLVQELDLDPDEFLLEVEGDAGSRADGFRHYLAARSVSLVEGRVYYYDRADLKPGERIADWVRPAGDRGQQKAQLPQDT